MRTERPEPWGFDLYDPRLTMRQQAADAQRGSADQSDIDEPTVVEESAPLEPGELEPVGGGAR
jgi:hypothetical protein